jgi:triacylglycerol lipase
MHTRRHLIALSLATTMLAACSSVPTMNERPPIVFIHGNGDSAALWQTTLWRFESNGWPRERLFAPDQPFPLARDDDSVAQPGRSSTAESMAFLKAEVERVLKATGATKVVLVGNSRGGNTIRNYVQNGGGDRVVSHVVLGGNPAHGIWAVKGLREGSEFSGLSPFMQRLNAHTNAAGDEVTPGVKWLTLRSDNNDKYAQPDGVWIGAKGTATNIGFDGPALKGATNIVLPGVDHRETSFSPAAFDATWRFLTGQAPRTLQPVAEPAVTLSGRVTGLGLDPLNQASGAFVNNLPLAGARLAICAVDPTTGARHGQAAWEQTIGADGRWGPFVGQPTAAYEFVLSAPGYATTHIYRSPFPRSSAVVQLRPERLAEADSDAKALVIFTRPRGYFDVQRDTIRFDGKRELPGVPPLGAGVSSSKLRLASDVPRSVAAEFNGERVAGQSWAAAQAHVSVLELTY